MKTSLFRSLKVMPSSLQALLPAVLTTMIPLSGCVTAGNDFKSETSWLKEGHTKQEDVRMVLGDPRSVGHSLGKQTWTYGYYRYFLVGDSYTKELKLYWEPNGSLSHYSFSSSFPDDKGQPRNKKKDQPKDEGF